MRHNVTYTCNKHFVTNNQDFCSYFLMSCQIHSRNYIFRPTYIPGDLAFFRSFFEARYWSSAINFVTLEECSGMNDFLLSFLQGPYCKKSVICRTSSLLKFVTFVDSKQYFQNYSAVLYIRTNVYAFNEK